jgi:GntR family transcriptional regulator
VLPRYPPPPLLFYNTIAARPRYVEIAGELRERIARGELAAGARLPGQRELGRDFGVTVMTVRQALALLEREGLVAARHGAGTFVAERPVAYRLDGLRSLADELAAQGVRLETRVLSARVEELGPAHARLLGRRTRRAYVVERLRLADDVPVALQRSLLAAGAERALRDVDLATRPLYEALESGLGLRVGRARETLRPVALGEREAGLLRVAPGAPAFESERVTLALDGAPLLLDVALLPGGRVVVAADRLPADAGVGYRLAASQGEE